MKTIVWVALLLMALIACTPNVSGPVTPIPNSLLARWVLTDTQSAGIGPPGIWAAASPQGQWMELSGNGSINGTVFMAATGFQVVDSATVKVTDPSQAAGFRLFNYRIDSVNHQLFFYKRPANGGYCTEGCGTYLFSR
jgi:hypothetical protein